MELRDVVATALAAAGVTGTATASACLTGKAWVGVLVASVLVLAAAVLLLISPPEEVVVPADTVSEPPQRTMRTTAPSLGIEVEESRQGTMPKIGHAIGQDPAFYEPRLGDGTIAGVVRDTAEAAPRLWRRKVHT